MIQGLAVRNIYPETSPNVEQQLQLLVEHEPRHRIFLRNFLDLILRRTEPPLFLASQPAHLGKHFYVRTGVHWMVVLESIVWHMTAVPLLLVLWTWSLSWEVRHYAVARSHTMDRQQELTYDPLSQAFPAREGRQHEEMPSERSKPYASALRLAKEQRRADLQAPDIAVNGTGHSEIASSNPTLPAVPLSATARSQLVLPGNLAEVIGPAPEGGQLSMRGVSGLATPVVAPPPRVSGAKRGGGISMPAGVVAPTPALQGSLGARTMGGVYIGSTAAVPPSPSLSLSEQRAGPGVASGTLAGSGVAVVPPAPSVRGRVYRSGGNGDLVGGTGTQVVAPSPSMGHSLLLAGGHGNSLAGMGEPVVPPAPSIRGRAYLAGNGGGTIGGVGTNVVAPSPMLGTGLVSRHGRGNSLGESQGAGVVPPAPSIAGSGVQGSGGGGVQSLGDRNGSVVPPAPTVGLMALHGASGDGHGRGVDSLSGGTQVVAPAPSLGGTEFGGSGTGLGNGGKSLVSSLGTQAVAPPGMGVGGSGAGIGAGNELSGTGSVGSSGPRGGGVAGGSGAASTGSGTEVARLGTSSLAGNGGGGASGAAPIISSAVPSNAEVPDIPAGKTEVVPLRVIQLALALPMSAYFSNYEAFIAERSVNRNTTQLIKLVYIFLPYQRRLTEFGVKPAKTFNLRVTRDPSCDESLLSMTWPEGERGQPAAEQSKDKLPCYRTTADDYRKAWQKAH